MSLLTPAHAQDWSCAKIKTWIGREGHGYSFTLVHRGVPVAEVMNDASGGPTSLEWNGLRWDGNELAAEFVKPAMRKTVKEAKIARLAWIEMVKALPPAMAVASLPPEMLFGQELTVNDDIALGSLLDIVKLKNKLTKKLLFEVGDKQFQMNLPYSAANRAYVLRRHPEAVILNEVWGIGL